MRGPRQKPHDPNQFWRQAKNPSNLEPCCTRQVPCAHHAAYMRDFETGVAGVDIYDIDALESELTIRERLNNFALAKLVSVTDYLLGELPSPLDALDSDDEPADKALMDAAFLCMDLQRDLLEERRELNAPKVTA